MKRQTLLLLLFSLFSYSCESLVETAIGNIVNNQDDNYVSPYSGTYIGTYSGQDSGTLKMTISKKGIVEVTKYSDNFKTDDTLYGTVVGASLERVISRETGYKLIGTLHSPTKTYTGTWTYSGLSGTWTMTKQ